MNRKTRALIDFTALYSDIILIYSYIIIFSYVGSRYDGEPVIVHVLPWVGLSVFYYFVNSILLSKGAKVNTFYVLNVIMVLGMIVLGGLYFSPFPPESLAGSFIKALAFLFIGTRPYYIAKNSVNSNEMLLHMEFSVVTYIFFLLLQGSELYQDIPVNYSLMLSIALTFMALILLRVKTENAVQVEGSRLQGGFLLGAMAAGLLIFSLGIVFMAASWVKMVLTHCVSLIIKGAVFLLSILKNIFIFLISLLPVGEMDGSLLAEPQTGFNIGPIEEMGADTSIIWHTIIFIGIVIAVILFLYILKLNKNKRMKQEVKSNMQGIYTIQKKGALWEKFIGWLRKMKQRAVFQYRYFKNRNSVEALFIDAEKFGKRNGISKQKWETEREYLLRLTQEILDFDEQTQEMLLQLADIINRTFYAKEPEALDKKAVFRFRKIFRGQHQRHGKRFPLSP